jgi:hypothetical protein
MRFELLMAMNITITAFWDVAAPGIVNWYQHFGGTLCNDLKTI